MIYKWKTGYHSVCSAETAHRVMSELEAQGRLTARELVNASRPEDAPLHNAFEWNDSIAAEKWREQQGRVIICNIEAVREEAPNEPVRAFFHIDAESSRYESMETIVQNTVKFRTLIDQAKADMRTFVSKYRTLESLRQITMDMESMLNII